MEQVFQSILKKQGWCGGGVTEPIIMLLYILGKVRQIYIVHAISVKISDLLLSKNQRAAHKSIKCHLLFFNNASYWDQSKLFKQNVDFCSEQI